MGLPDPQHDAETVHQPHPQPASTEHTTDQGATIPRMTADTPDALLPDTAPATTTTPEHTAQPFRVLVTGSWEWRELPILDPDTIDAGPRCGASTGVPADEARQCRVHPDGGHRCYQGPNHQGAKATGHTDGSRAFALTVPPSGCLHTLPEYATHTCDCGFRWANVVQAPAPEFVSGPGALPRRPSDSEDPYRGVRV